MSSSKGKVLVIAGSDSGSAAGIQADIKTIMALGGYALCAISAITVQNTKGVFAIHELPANIVKQQAKVVLDDIGADVIKIGMLSSQEIIESVLHLLEEYKDIPVVLDPVMVATSGDSLFDDGALDGLKELISKAYLVTPNIDEAQILANMDINNIEQAIIAGKEILELGCDNVLVKGGHLDGDEVIDVLVNKDGEELFTGNRVKNVKIHGTGCTTASAIACNLAKGNMLSKSVNSAKEYVIGAIKANLGLGEGNSPLGHGYLLKSKE